MTLKLYELWLCVKGLKPDLTKPIDYDILLFNKLCKPDKILIFTDEIDNNIKKITNFYDCGGFVISQQSGKIPSRYKHKVENFVDSFVIETKIKYDCLIINSKNLLEILKNINKILNRSRNMIIILDLEYVNFIIDNLFKVSNLFQSFYFKSTNNVNTVYLFCNIFISQDINEIYDNLTNDEKDINYLKFINKFELVLMDKINYLMDHLQTK